MSITLAAWFSNHRLGLKGIQFFKTVIYFPNLIIAASFALLFSSMKPAFAVQMIFKFVESWNNYFIPGLILHEDSKKTMPIVISLIRSANFANYDNGLIYMVIAFSILPSVIIYLFLSRFIISGITSGGVKG